MNKRRRKVGGRLDYMTIKYGLAEGEQRETFDREWLFSNTVELGDTSCWIWQGHLSERNGVPQTGYHTPVRPLVLILYGQDVPKSKSIPITCQHTGCVNPHHMIW